MLNLPTQALKSIIEAVELFREHLDRPEQGLLAFLGLRGGGSRRGNLAPRRLRSAGAIILAGLTALVEEFVFRGLVLAAVREAYGGPAAVLFSSMLFASMYLGSLSPAYFVIISLVGLYFGYCVLKTGSLAGVVVAHGLMNLGLLFVWRGRETEVPLTVAVNPVIEPLDDETAAINEGCLSVPDLRGEVDRHMRIRVRRLDRDGTEIVEERRGLTAGTFQHELDHLDGVLFLDRLDPETRKAAMKEIRESEWFGLEKPTVKVSPHDTFGLGL